MILLAQELPDQNERRFADPRLSYLVGDIRQRAAYGVAFRPGRFINDGNGRGVRVATFYQTLRHPVNTLDREINRHGGLMAGK